MKKLTLAVLAVILGLAGSAHAVCDTRTTTCLTALDVVGNTSVGSLTNLGASTVSGSQSITGNLTTAGKMVFTPASVVAVTSMTTLSPTSPYLIISSTGNIVTIGGTIPSIATTTAVNGQFIVLGSTQTGAGANTVSISSGTASLCDLGAATRNLSYGKKLGLMFDSLTGYWTEIFYGSN